jgi:hypothetical protein
MAAVKKPHRGQFQPGNPGGGRPIGSRNRLTEVALAALGADFAEHGPAVIEEVRKTKPHVYLQVVASLLPRQVQMEKLSSFSDISDEELEQLERYLSASRAQTVHELNGSAIALEPKDAKQQGS